MALSSQELILVHLVKLLSQVDRIGLRLQTDEMVINANRGGMDVAAEPQTTVPPSVADAPAVETPVRDPGSRRAPESIETGSPDAVVVRAPISGTFYSRPEPSAEPFCTAGSEIDEHDTVCIIEVMKLFNSIPAGVSGRVRQVLQEDGGSVQTNDPLFVIEPV